MSSLRVGWRLVLASLIVIAPLATPAQAAREMPVTTSSKQARVSFDQGRDHLADAEIALSAPLFDKATQADRKFALAHAYRAIAGGGLEALVKLHPDDKQVQLRAGSLAQGNGDWPTAATHFDKAAALDPGYAAALEFTAKGMRDSAWTLYQEAVARERKGDAAAAKKAFADLARWNQNDLGYALVRARVLARVGAAQ